MGAKKEKRQFDQHEELCRAEGKKSHARRTEEHKGQKRLGEADKEKKSVCFHREIRSYPRELENVVKDAENEEQREQKGDRG